MDDNFQLDQLLLQDGRDYDQPLDDRHQRFRPEQPRKAPRASSFSAGRK